MGAGRGRLEALNAHAVVDRLHLGLRSPHRHHFAAARRGRGFGRRLWGRILPNGLWGQGFGHIPSKAHDHLGRSFHGPFRRAGHILEPEAEQPHGQGSTGGSGSEANGARSSKADGTGASCRSCDERSRSRIGPRAGRTCACAGLKP